MSKDQVLREQTQQTTALGKDHHDGYHDDKPHAECLICAHEVEGEMSKPSARNNEQMALLNHRDGPPVYSYVLERAEKAEAEVENLRAELKAEAERIWASCQEIALNHECQTYKEACCCSQRIADDIHAAQAKGSEG